MSRDRSASAPRARRLRRTAAGLVALGAGAFASAAHAQERWSVDASASAGISTNPYLGQGSGGTALQGTLELRPTVVIARPLTNIQLSADGQVTFYDKNYPTNESLALTGFGTYKLSPQSTLNAQLTYVNTIVGSVNSARVPVVDVPPDTILPTYVIDPSLGGIGRRRQALQVGGGISTALSARDQIGGNVSASLNRFSGAVLSDFNYVTPSFYWRRALSEQSSIGASLTAGLTDYLHTRVGDATTYSPQVNFSRGLGNGWTLDAGAGVTFVRLHEATGGTRSTTGVSGSASACRRDTRRNICLSASRQIAPSAFQGVRTETSVAGSLGYRLNAVSDLSLNAGYSHAGEPLQRSVVGVRDDSTDYVTASGTYSRRLGPAFSGFVTAGYAKTLGDRFGRGGNLTAQVGVSYRFGSPQ